LNIPAPRSPPLGSLYEGIRYENGRWPLWRWDRNLRYLVKSVVHRRTPWTMEDREHHARARAYLESGAWQRSVAAPSRVLAGGDLMWIRSGFSGAIAPPLRARIAAADLALVNLETPMVPERPVPRLVYETLHYNSPPGYLDAWRGARACAVSLCNNHALDQGRDGLRRTCEVVESLGLLALGGVDPGDAISGARVGDLAVGLTALTYDINHLEGTAPAGIPVARFGDPAHEPDWPRIAAQITATKRAGADLVILLAHWGFEYEYWPAAVQRAHARRLIELGVDVIVGSSPHVLQPVEIVSVDGADPACPLQATRGGPPRFALIAWSLGNLATIMPTLPCRVGALLEIDVGRDARGVPAFSGLRAIPTVSARGLGATWLDGATLPLEHEGAELAHARAMLGKLIEPRGLT
jgi:poly-gamma-glutamate capsule biosynthesis protein CapA/YwtB (metallophosphatase superfamily)